MYTGRPVDGVANGEPRRLRHGGDRGQNWVVAPAFVTADDPAARVVALDAGLPMQDMQPGGLVSPPDLRAYATREARYRLHQQRFKLDVMRAYRHRCAICTLRERELVQAAHIVPDAETEGVAAVVNGIALCAIHHLASTATCSASTPWASAHRRPAAARDRRADAAHRPAGFPRGSITLSRRPQDQPDPHRLALRFERFVRASA